MCRTGGSIAVSLDSQATSLLTELWRPAGDIMDVKSASLGIESLRSIQIVKSSLMAKKTTSTEFFQREDRLYTPVRPGLIEKMVSAGRIRNEDLSRKRTEKELELMFMKHYATTDVNQALKH